MHCHGNLYLLASLCICRTLHVSMLLICMVRIEDQPVHCIYSKTNQCKNHNSTLCHGIGTFDTLAQEFTLMKMQVRDRESSLYTLANLESAHTQHSCTLNSYVTCRSRKQTNICAHYTLAYSTDCFSHSNRAFSLSKKT